jgi:hypothetical protein
MKINEVITKKERIDEILPLLAPLIPAAKVAAGWAARHGLKKVASQVGHIGHKLSSLGRKWGTKSPPDSSTPDALAGSPQVARPKPKEQSLYSKRTRSAFERT